MTLPNSLAELQSWETYRAFLKLQLKQLPEDQDQPVYITKDKIAFEVLGKAWNGHAVLAGPKAQAVIQSLRKDGVHFREASCRNAGGVLRVSGLQSKLGNEVNKTLSKLKVSKFVVEGAAEAEAGESGEPAAGNAEAAWKELKARLGPLVRGGLASGGAQVERIQALVAQASAREKAGDFAAATAAFEQLAPLLSSAAAGARSGKDPLDQVIEDALGDPQKRLEALAKWKVPRYSEEYKNDTPEIRFLKDMESGTKKASEYLGYIKDGLEYYEKYGELVGLGRAGEAAQGLKKITGQLSGGLKQVGKVIEGVKNAAVWLVALKEFADTSGEMKPTDRASVIRWVDSVGHLYDATAPFLEWVQSKALTAALGGSSAAGALGATLPIVTAQFFIGLKTLQQGVKNVDAYISRLEKWQKLADEAEHGRPAPPPPPSYPGDWKTREEEARTAVARENDELRRRIRAERDDKTRAAAEDFDTQVFPKLYLQGRAGIKRRILDAMRRAGGKTYTPGDVLESSWWECLLPGDGEPVFDEQAGVDIAPKRDTVTLDEALQEISEFQGLSKPCPYFQELYERARQAHLAKVPRSAP